MEWELNCCRFCTVEVFVTSLDCELIINEVFTLRCSARCYVDNKWGIYIVVQCSVLRWCVACKWWRRWDWVHRCHSASLSWSRRHWHSRNHQLWFWCCGIVSQLCSWWKVSWWHGELVETERGRSVLERQMWKSAKCCLSILKHCYRLVCV